jgi:hypothetical protein
MIGNEGKTRILYNTYTKAGFDPDKDMLQVNVMPPERYAFMPSWASFGPHQWREGGFCSGGGLVIDWDLKTSLEGLYAAGQQQLLRKSDILGGEGRKRRLKNAKFEAKNRVFEKLNGLVKS